MIVYMHVCLCTICKPEESFQSLGPRVAVNQTWVLRKIISQCSSNHFLFVFVDRFVCGPGCPGTHLLSQSLELKVCATTAWHHHPHARRLRNLFSLTDVHNTVPLMYIHIQTVPLIYTDTTFCLFNLLGKVHPLVPPKTGFSLCNLVVLELALQTRLVSNS